MGKKTERELVKALRAEKRAHKETRRDMRHLAIREEMAVSKAISATRTKSGVRQERERQQKARKWKEAAKPYEEIYMRHLAIQVAWGGGTAIMMDRTGRRVKSDKDYRSKRKKPTDRKSEIL